VANIVNTGEPELEVTFKNDIVMCNKTALTDQHFNVGTVTRRAEDITKCFEAFLLQVCHLLKPVYKYLSCGA